MGEVKKIEKSTEVEKKRIIEISDINELLNTLVIVHKIIPSEISNQLIDLKISTTDHVKNLNKLRETLQTIVADTEELKLKAMNEKWGKEVLKEVEFPIQKISKENMKTIIDANKETGLTGGQISALYEIFKVNQT